MVAIVMVVVQTNGMDGAARAIDEAKLIEGRGHGTSVALFLIFPVLACVWIRTLVAQGPSHGCRATTRELPIGDHVDHFWHIQALAIVVRRDETVQQLERSYVV